MNVVLLAEQDNNVIFSKILAGGFKTSQALKMLGMLNLIKGNGIREYKNFDKSFYRTKKQLDSIEYQDNYLFECFRQIKTDILELKPLRLEDYKDRF